VLKFERDWLVEGSRDRMGADVRRDWSGARCSNRSGAIYVPKRGYGVLVDVAHGGLTGDTHRR
jgi:hypothetical protein